MSKSREKDGERVERKRLGHTVWKEGAKTSPFEFSWIKNLSRSQNDPTIETNERHISDQILATYSIRTPIDYDQSQTKQSEATTIVHS